MSRYDINLVFSGMDRLKSMQTQLVHSIDNAKKLNQKFDDMDDELIKINNRMDELKKKRSAFDELISNTPLSALADMSDKFQSFNEALSTVGGSQGFAQQTSDMFANFGAQSQMYAANFKSIFGGGIKGMTQQIALMSKGLIAGFSGIATAIGAIAAPIAIIVAGIFTISRVWKQNIGGIQTYFNKIVGQMKTIWAKFIVSFDKALRKLAPLFKIVFGTLYAVAKPILDVIGGLFEGVMHIVDALAEVIGELIEPFAELFANKERQETFNILSAIGEVLKFVGKGIAAVIKHSPGFKVLKVVFKLIAAGLKVIDMVMSKVVEKFKESKLLKLWIMSLNYVIERTVGKVMNLYESFKKTKIGGAIIKSLVVVWKELSSAIEYVLNLYEKLDKFLGIEDKAKSGVSTTGKSQSASMLVDRERALQTTKTVSNTSSQTTNSPTINIHSSGAISEKSAPRIGGMLKTLLTSKV